MRFLEATVLMVCAASLRVHVDAFSFQSTSLRSTATSASSVIIVPSSAPSSSSSRHQRIMQPLFMSSTEDELSIADIQSELEQIQTEFISKIEACESMADAEALRVEYLGKKGPINKSMGYMRSLPDEDKPKLGALVNSVKANLEKLVNAKYPLREEEAKKKSEKKQKKKKSAPAPTDAGPIDISKLDIRVGVINKVWEHEEADKLYCEEIDLGEEGGPRQIASGLKAHYSLEEMEGRKVLVLANLKSRKLVGFPSHGMVLCAASDDGKDVEFVEPPEGAEIGERVMVEGFDGEPATENQVIKKKMLDAVFPDLATNDSGVATYQGKPLSTSDGVCTSGIKNSPIA